MTPTLLLGVVISAHSGAQPSPAQPSHEQPADAERAHDEAHSERFIIAGKLVVGTSRAIEGSTALFGPGADFEVALVPELGIELEVAGAFLLGNTKTSVPVELLLKKAFHFGRRTDLFVAIGVVGNFTFEKDHDDELLVGGIGVVGAYLWHSESFGLVIELSYSPYLLAGGLEQDLEGGFGVAYRF